MNTVVVVPTYNERDNVAVLVGEVAALGIDGLEVLVVDDDSPDGTARVVEDLARAQPFVRLLRRTGPRGRGYAVRDGYLRALAAGADRIVEMDADLSHHPRHVPALLAASESADLVLGSRGVAGGRDDDRPAWRRVLTVLANRYTRTMLGVRVTDPNAGFRCFRGGALERIDPATLVSRGPASVQETLFRAHRQGLRIAEVPITFENRGHGDSKLAWWQLREVMLAVARLRWHASSDDAT